MIRARVIVVAGVAAFGLAACSPDRPFPETEGVSQKEKMDFATKVYADCVTTAAADADFNNDAAGSIANRVVQSCKETRNTLMAEVIAFHQIGHPKFSIAQSKAVAEASIATIEDELRRQAVVSIVSRQLASSSGQSVGTPTTGGQLPGAAGPAPGTMAPPGVTVRPE